MIAYNWTVEQLPTESVSITDVRMSQDAQYPVCIMGGDVRCLYVPGELG